MSDFARQLVSLFALRSFVLCRRRCASFVVRAVQPPALSQPLAKVLKCWRVGVSAACRRRVDLLTMYLLMAC